MSVTTSPETASDPGTSKTQPTAPTTATTPTPTTAEAAARLRRPYSRRAALFLLRAYQGAASGRVSTCRYYPSCSNYAMEAFSVHGFWRAFGLTARRLLRCRPFGPHGVDLVPLPDGSAEASGKPDTVNLADKRHNGGLRQAGHLPGHTCDQELNQVGTPC